MTWVCFLFSLQIEAIPLLRKTFSIPNSATNSGAIRWYMTAGNEVELHCPAKQNGLICFH